jgi:hypothetical protein
MSFIAHDYSFLGEQFKLSSEQEMLSGTVTGGNSPLVCAAGCVFLFCPGPVQEEAGYELDSRRLADGSAACLTGA